jgi:glucose/arabinose dehydrogenase
MMLRSLAAAVAAACLLAGAARAADVPANTLTEAEKTAGWTLLFDGKDFDGWRNYKKKDVSKGWKVEDGAMVRAGGAAGDIVTKDEYDNFELLLEYKISEGGNSGLMFLVTEDGDAPWYSGPEVQIQDNKKGHDPQKSGWLYQLYESSKPRWDVTNHPGLAAITSESGHFDSTRPAGEWNQIYLRVTKGQCAIAMNGVPYSTFDVGSDDWNKRVAKSKFAQFPGFAKAEKGHICLQDHGNEVAFRNIKLRKVGPNGEAPNPVHGKLNVQPVLAFPDLEFEGWEPEQNGKLAEFRPIVMTHAGDGSHRMFVASQRGVVYVFKNEPVAKTATKFLDIESKVKPFFSPGANEEGLLGLAFHPKFKENGKLYVYYTARGQLKSIVSEFTASKQDPSKADPASERVLMTIDEPFQNHNGGAIEFGPDGFLYIALGDGGAAHDPDLNGQNINTLLGSILRIDVDSKAAGKEYGIPKDNPFVGKDGADEIFAFGFRNPWRIGFDRKTGQLWAADVGQDLWEEIDVVNKGGNYGWSVKEGTHPFRGGTPTGGSSIPPVWEYDHQVGKSITGGYVYRGKAVPELDGHYLYADYVSLKLWALKADDPTGAGAKNYEIPVSRETGPLAILAYGQDESGEIYFGVATAAGKGIYKFESAGKQAAAK